MDPYHTGTENALSYTERLRMQMEPGPSTPCSACRMTAFLRFTAFDN